MFRIDRRRSPAKQLGKGRADERGARKILRQRRARRGAIRAAHDVEGPRPVVVRHLGRLVPVVHGLVDQQQRLLAGREKHEGIRRVGERRPHLEGRLDAEWQVMIVEEQQRRRAGVHQQGVVARRFAGQSRCVSSRPRGARRTGSGQESAFCLIAGEFMARFYASANDSQRIDASQQIDFPAARCGHLPRRERRDSHARRVCCRHQRTNNCSCFKWIGESIKSRAAVQIAATNVCLVSLTTRYFWGTPT